MPHDVFISYSSKDKPIADAICAHIEAAGLRCWIAPRDIAPGDDWPTAIAQAIAGSQAMVLVFSANSNASPEVGRELYLAADHKLVILPFKIENVEPEPGKMYYLASTHWLDALNPPTREQIQELVDFVRKLVPARGEPGAVNVAPTAVLPMGQPPAPGRMRSAWRGPGIALGAFLGLGVILLIAWATTRLAGKLLVPAATSTYTPSPTEPATWTPAPLPTQTAQPVPTEPAAVTITPSGSGQAVSFNGVYISDPFNNNDLQWSVGDTAGPDWTGTCSIANGVLSWEGTSAVPLFLMDIPAGADQQAALSDEQVSARVKMDYVNAKVGYGLILRSASDQSSLYAFIISSGQFTFQYWGDNAWRTVLEWQASPYLTTDGWNTLKVQSVGSHFRFFFNDHLLGEADDTALSSGLNGIMVDAYDANEKIQLQFDDFEVLLPAH